MYFYTKCCLGQAYCIAILCLQRAVTKSLAPNIPEYSVFWCCNDMMLKSSQSTTQHNTTQHNTTQHNTTQHNTTQHNTTQHNTTQHNTTQHNTTQHNTPQHNTTQHNTWFLLEKVTGTYGTHQKKKSPVHQQGPTRAEIASPGPMAHIRLTKKISWYTSRGQQG